MAHAKLPEVGDKVTYYRALNAEPASATIARIDSSGKVSICLDSFPVIIHEVTYNEKEEPVNRTWNYA